MINTKTHSETRLKNLICKYNKLSIQKLNNDEWTTEEEQELQEIIEAMADLFYELKTTP